MAAKLAATSTKGGKGSDGVNVVPPWRKHSRGDLRIYCVCANVNSVIEQALMLPYTDIHSHISS